MPLPRERTLLGGEGRRQADRIRRTAAARELQSLAGNKQPDSLRTSRAGPSGRTTGGQVVNHVTEGGGGAWGFLRRGDGKRGRGVKNPAPVRKKPAFFRAEFFPFLLMVV